MNQQSSVTLVNLAGGDQAWGRRWSRADRPASGGTISRETAPPAGRPVPGATPFQPPTSKSPAHRRARTNPSTDDGGPPMKFVGPARPGSYRGRSEVSLLAGGASIPIRAALWWVRQGGIGAPPFDIQWSRRADRGARGHG